MITEVDIYRCTNKIPTGMKRKRRSIRIPGNVPYVVDNLWEWKRPRKFPSRRHSVFASPTAELAKKSGPEDGKVYRVKFNGKYNLCQIAGYSDAKNHPDCKMLKKKMLNILGNEWLGGNVENKEKIGRLWIPCLTKRDLNFLFGTVEELRGIRDDIYDSVTLWDDVIKIENNMKLPDDKGEIFFEVEIGYFLE